jgi:SP family myo-inositol transporter-like MFS transporter 13
MVGLGAVPPGVFMFRCPESPRQLLFHNKREECEKVIRLIYPNATED